MSRKDYVKACCVASKKFLYLLTYEITLVRMSTLDHFAQPDLIPSCRRLAATDILLFLPDDTTQTVPANILKRREGIFKKGIEYLTLVKNGFNASRYGRHSVAYSESVRAYGELSDFLGYEAACAGFPVQIDNYCRTIETLASGQQPSSNETDDLKRFLKRISPASDKRESSQASTESLLKNLSYVSH